MKTLALVARSFPPQVSGSAVLLANLLASYKQPVFVLAGYAPLAISDASFARPVETIDLCLPHSVPRALMACFRLAPDFASWLLSVEIIRRLKVRSADVLMASCPAAEYAVAAYIAARCLRIPFYLHMHDLWQENLKLGNLLYRFSSKWEPRLIQDSTRLLCMTEEMQAHYGARYGVHGELMAHTVAAKAIEDLPSGMKPADLLNPRIVFVGNISEQMNTDALRQFSCAADLLPDNYRTQVYTPASLECLWGLGICSRRLEVTYARREQIAEIQSRAAVLVALLSHKRCSAAEVRTVFSTKLLEYFTSGRPILVFAPADSHHARSAAELGWGHVVTEDDPKLLARAIVRLVEDTGLAAKCVSNALEEARRRCSAVNAARLAEYVARDSQ